MTWRKNWAKNWESVKFCSDACRRAGLATKDEQLEAAILRLLGERGAGKTICPSEAARAVAATDEREAWEPLMEPARAAARRLVAQGRIVITQGGRPVDASTAKGPIRLRLH
jgi:nucleoid-associated protein YgaU